MGIIFVLDHSYIDWGWKSFLSTEKQAKAEMMEDVIS